MSHLVKNLPTRSVITIFALSLLVAGCNLPIVPDAGVGSSAKIVSPADGAQLGVGELIDIQSSISDPGGAGQVYLIVNGEPLREDNLTTPMQSGTMYQPWRPTEPGKYTLQVVVITSGGSTLESNIVTVYVDGESQPQAEITITPTVPTVEEITITITPTLTETITPTPTETITPTPTQGAPTATADQDANCRFGPSQVYHVIGHLLQNQTAPIVGRNTDSSWWVIERTDGAGTCWIWDGTVTVSGDTSGVPVIQPPPPPTDTPTPTPSPTPTAPPPLTAPTPISPTGTQNCANVTGGVDLMWTMVSHPNGIDHYEWELEGPGGPQSGSSGSTLASTSGLSCAGSNYQWRVRAVDGIGNIGPWSNYASFNVP